MVYELLSNILDKYVKNLAGSEYISIYLEAGHHSPGELSVHSTTSYQFVLEVAKKIKYQYKRKVKVTLGILVDDLGLACSETSCDSLQNDLQSNSCLRDLNELYEQSNFRHKYPQLLFSERATKNRGIKLLKSKINSGNYPSRFLTHKHDSELHIYYNLKNTNLLLGSSKGWTTNMRCPLLMAQHYYEVFSSMYKILPSATHFFAFDWSLFSEKSKVSQGNYIFSDLKQSYFDLQNHQNCQVFNIFSDPSLSVNSVLDFNGQDLLASRKKTSKESKKYANLFGL